MQWQILKLRGKTIVFVDWANVYGWRSGVDSKSIFEYLKQYKQIKSTYFYFGTDENEKSQKFIKQAAEIGFSVITKPVKHIIVGKIAGTLIKKRKCDFDIEICMTVYESLKSDFQTFIFFSGDGDLAPLYNYLIKNKKQVIVIYEKGHLGKEVWEISKGLFKTRLSYLNVGKKNNPPK